MTPTLPRRIVAEFLGTGLLVAAVVGSGIMGERLAGGNIAIALLANTIATGAALIALILTFGPISGAHFNPAVTLADAIERGVSWTVAACYVPAQCVGGICGAIAAHLMFGLPTISLSHHARSGPAQVFSEFVATFGLLCVIWGCSRQRSADRASRCRGLHHAARTGSLPRPRLQIRRSQLLVRSPTRSQEFVPLTCLCFLQRNSPGQSQQRSCSAGSCPAWTPEPNGFFAPSEPSGGWPTLSRHPKECL